MTAGDDQPRVSSVDLDPLARALDVLDEHAEINHRYRKLITDSRAALGDDTVRLTQARGMAKKLMVLVRAAGSGFREHLSEHDRALLESGEAQAEQLVYDPESGTGRS